MATSVATLVPLSSSSISCSNRRKITTFFSFPPPSSLKCRNSQEFWKDGSRKRARQPTRNSAAEGVPSELAEDAKFVPLSPDDPVYGPPALLLIGFEGDEISKIQEFLKELDGEFLKVILCTEDMLTQSIWDAMHIEQPNLEAVEIAKSLPRMCIMSGLSGEEMMMFIDAFPETGLKPAVFAALVPNSADKRLIDVAEEIMGDHEMMAEKQENRS